MRILIVIAPQMYRESLALALERYRPQTEVVIARPQTLDGEVGRFQPHLLVYDEGTDPQMPASVACWIEVQFTDGLDAKVGVDGQVADIKNIGTRDLLAIVDRVERLIG